MSTDFCARTARRCFTVTPLDVAYLMTGVSDRRRRASETRRLGRRSWGRCGSTTEARHVPT